MKKSIVIVCMLLSIVLFQNYSEAQVTQNQSAGLGDIIFETNTTTGYGGTINEISYAMIQLHLTIAGKNTKASNYEGETLATIQKLEELTKTDIIEVLNIATNKQEALIAYLNDCEQNLQKGDSISAYMKQEIVLFKGDMESCLTEKNISDKSYFDAISRYDQKIMEASLADSISYENCATENRIQYNAKASIAEKLVFYLGLLQKKYDVLFAKQEILAKNFEIFRDNILPDLNQIDQILQQYKF